MRGVHCSWVEMAKIRQELAMQERGDQQALAHLRCVQPGTVSKWRLCLSVMDAIAGKVSISTLCNVQPSHASIIGRAFRKSHGKQWSDAVREEIADLVEECEGCGWTVEQLKARLRCGGPVVDVDEGCTVDDLGALASSGQKFGTIYADPPWQYGNQATRASTSNHYHTMSMDQLRAMPVAELAAEESHLHLWTTNAFLRESLDLIGAWGFEYKSVFVWVKPQMGIGNYWRVSHEFLLLGVRGGLTFADKTLMSWQQLKRTKHSKKPYEVRAAIEKASPGPRLELFGRQTEPGWVVWGNEVQRQDMFEGENVEVSQHGQ